MLRWKREVKKTSKMKIKFIKRKKEKKRWSAAVSMLWLSRKPVLCNKKKSSSNGGAAVDSKWQSNSNKLTDLDNGRETKATSKMCYKLSWTMSIIGYAGRFGRHNKK